MATEPPHSDKRPWRTIAQEMSVERDSAHMTELSRELLEAMDEQERSLSRAKKKTEAESARAMKFFT